MYEKFWGVKELPFDVSPNPRFAFRSLSYEQAYGKMMFAADYKQGLAILTGQIGAGKTTIANSLVAQCDKDKKKAVAFLPVADDRGRAAFLKRVMDGFGISSSKRLYSDNRSLLENFLIEQYEAGKHAILVIDEGQKIHPDNFDTLVDLTNIQTATQKLITVILFAQDGNVTVKNNLSNKIRVKEAFTSRVVFFAHLDPLSPEDMEGMIAHRLRIAGAKFTDLSVFFTSEALVELYVQTKGIPRDVCIFLTNLMLDAYVRNEKPIQKEHILATLTAMERLGKWPVQIKEIK